MKRSSMAAVALSLVLLVTAGLTLRPAQAQDDMMTHVCDSTLIALLFVAEYEYGFEAMSVDVATLEKGQFQPLFESMMAMMDGDMMDEGEDMAEGDMMATEEPMMEDTMMVTLLPGHIADEDPACTALRDELDAFLFHAFEDSLMMGAEG